MKYSWKIVGLLILMMGAAIARIPVHNAFLETGGSAEFRGTEWNDDYAPKDIPLSVKVVTEEVQPTHWGGIFKITFEDVKSSASTKREIQPLYFVATKDVIALLNEEKTNEAIARIAGIDKPPAFEDTDIYGLSHGSKKLSDARSHTTVKTEKDTCTYLYSDDSGTFTKVVWKMGVGLVEYGQGGGAHRDGFRLKRVAAAKLRNRQSRGDSFCWRRIASSV